jgi:hypothetical protein
MNSLLVLASLVVAQTAADEVRFRKAEQGKIEVVGPLTAAQKKVIPLGKLAAEQGEAWLRLSLIDSKSGKAGPAMLGSYERDAAELIFRPRLGLEAGQTYRAFFGPEGGPVVTKDYRPPLRNGGATPTVTKIYPSAHVLPANHLKFYIYFSQPMRGGREIFSQIEILDAAGNPISDAWLTDELWDETGQVLIIYIHPGRIKWGLVLREVLGPVLVPDRDYTLVIRGAMVDVNGHKLGKDVTKKVRTTAEDRVRVNLGDWKLAAPKTGTSDALTVEFGKSIDHKALQRLLTIRDSKGDVFAGKVLVGKDEKSWSFTPSKSWAEQEYTLRVDGRLEDVAGNTPLRPFDLDLEAPKMPAQRLEIPVRPR